VVQVAPEDAGAATYRTIVFAGSGICEGRCVASY